MKIYVWTDESGWKKDWTSGGIAVKARSLENAKRMLVQLGGFWGQEVPDPCEVLDMRREGVILDCHGGG